MAIVKGNYYVLPIRVKVRVTRVGRAPSRNATDTRFVWYRVQHPGGREAFRPSCMREDEFSANAKPATIVIGEGS